MKKLIILLLLLFPIAVYAYPYYGELGKWHIKVDQVYQAVSEIDYPIDKIEHRIYFSPYKCSNENVAAYAFQDYIIIYSVDSLFSATKNIAHKIAVHEIGHLLHKQFVYDWQEYLNLRGISYSDEYKEIFADDFRMLFGGERAKRLKHCKGDNPNEIAGLREYFVRLVYTEQK